MFLVAHQSTRTRTTRSKSTKEADEQNANGELGDGVCEFDIDSDELDREADCNRTPVVFGYGIFSMPASAMLLPLLVALSLLAWAVIAWVHLIPWLDRHSRREGLLLVVMPHMFRHVGAMAMFPGLADVPRD